MLGFVEIKSNAQSGGYFNPIRTHFIKTIRYPAQLRKECKLSPTIVRFTLAPDLSVSNVQFSLHTDSALIKSIEHAMALIKKTYRRGDPKIIPGTFELPFFIIETN